MKYRNIYNKNDISLNAGILFGPVGISNQYELVKTDKQFYCIRSANDNSQELSYFDIDENQLYTDILEYGKQLYEILKDSLTPININKLSSRNPNNIIYSNEINKHIQQIEPICMDFIENYGIPISIEDQEIIQNDIFYYLNKDCYNIVPVVSIVRYILLLFMLHQVLINLDETINKYPQIYNCLLKESDNSKLSILENLSKFSNNSNNFLNVSSKYMIKVLVDNDGELIPIRYSTNLFTFAFEAFTNCLCTLSFKQWENDDTYSYISFRKCQKCLKNIFDEPNVSTVNDRIPFNKYYVCEDCKKHAKRISSRKYEYSLRAMYDELKSNIDNCNPILASKIKDLNAKDKETKKHLKALLDELYIDLQKKE